MVSCTSDIRLGSEQFDYLTELEVRTAWRTLTDTAALRMPRQVIHKYDLQHRKYDDIVRRGDKVDLQWGYDYNHPHRFQGYVTGNKPGMPMVIEMEDEMFRLKERSVDPKAFTGTVQVDDILKYIGVTDYELIGQVGVLGDFSIGQDMTAAKVLLKLKDSIGFPVFYRDGRLHVGDPYQAQKPRVVNLKFGENVVDWNLEFKHADDIKLKVIAISKLKNGKKLKVILGDKDGEVHTLNFEPLDKETLKLRAKALFGKLKYTGYRGDLTLFGEPYVQHGEVVNFMDDEQEILGKYWTDAVNRTSNMVGVRQKVKIGVIADGGQEALMDEYTSKIQVIG